MMPHSRINGLYHHRLTGDDVHLARKPRGGGRWRLLLCAVFTVILILCLLM